MEPKEVSRTITQAIVSGLKDEQLCTCEGCVVLRGKALAALRQSSDTAQLTREQAAQLAHDLDYLRRHLNQPRATVAAPLRALGFVPALSDADEQSLMEAVYEMHRQAGKKGRPTLNTEPHMMESETAQFLAHTVGFLLYSNPNHPQAAGWEALIANLLCPEMDGTDSQFAGVSVIDQEMNDLLIRVRNAGAAGEIAGLSAQHQQTLEAYRRFCRELGVEDEIPMMDTATLAAISAAAPLAPLSEKERQKVTAFLARLEMPAVSAAPALLA